MHETIAEGLRESDPSSRSRTATLDQPEHGLTDAVLAETDVLTWWGHAAHAEVEDRIVDRVQKRVLEGMGLIVLHSGALRENLQAAARHHLLADLARSGREGAALGLQSRRIPSRSGIDRYFEIPHEEMYGEPFAIPESRRGRFPELVRGRRGLPLRLHLEARQREKSFTSAPATKLTRPITRKRCGKSSATPCSGRGRPTRGSTPARTCLAIRRPRKSSRSAGRCTSRAKKDSNERRTKITDRNRRPWPHGREHGAAAGRTAIHARRGITTCVAKWRRNWRAN